MRVAIVHDYLTQRGGAERIVLSMLKAFPEAPLYTSLYEPQSTFQEFRDVDVRTLALDRIGLLRRYHRLALPVLARAFSQLHVDADVVICSSSGWAHGAKTRGRKVVYCYAPARWLYQSNTYLSRNSSLSRVALWTLRSSLAKWDLRAAASAHLYLTLSKAVQADIRRIYGIHAEVLPPPFTIDPHGAQRPIESIEPGFLLCAARLLPYKNVEAVVEAFRLRPSMRLVVAGAGPERKRIERAAPPNVTMLGAINDDRQLRWLYANSVGVVSASYEDFGLTPIEGAAFGKPSAVLRWGGFLDTVVENETGMFFDAPEPTEIAHTLDYLLQRHFDPGLILRHASKYSEDVFVERLRGAIAP